MRVSFPVEGMTCASCVARVEKAIAKVDGISEVTVNLATEMASFEIDSNNFSPESLITSIERYGYHIDVSSLTTSKTRNRGREQSNIFKKEETSLKKDFLTALVLTLPIFILSMTTMFEQGANLISLSPDILNKLLLVLSTPVMFLPGKRFFSSFWNNTKHFAADMNSLIAVGAGSAYLYSVLVTLFPEYIGMHHAPHTFFETAAVIITFILMGKWLEGRSKEKTTGEIKKLFELRPDTAAVRRENSIVTIQLSDLELGDIVIAKPGEKIAADGVITEGSSFIDESLVSGESYPVHKKVSDKVTGGTLNKNGYIEFQITALGENSVLGKIIQIVEEAQSSKAPVQNLADKIASVFVPVVILIAIITFIGWYFFGVSEYLFATAMMRFVAVLIIACPCALGLATPTAIIVASGTAARKGILIKNGEALETAHSITTMVMDKTGTLTIGRPEVVNASLVNFDNSFILCALSALESKSEHPLALAIIEYCASKGISNCRGENFKSIPGMGISGEYEGKKIKIGRKEFAKPLEGFASSNLTSIVSVIHIEIDKTPAGLLIIADSLKAHSLQAIQQLKNMDIKVVLLSGDNENAVQLTAKELGVDEYYSQVMPEGKAKVIEQLQKRGEVVGMIGDGINDTPALAMSNVAFAVGSGTDVSIQTAQITILNDDIRAVSQAVALSKKTLRIIKQNLFLAFIYNIIGIPLSAFGYLDPMIAALAMSLSSVSVISNSLRLRKFTDKQ